MLTLHKYSFSSFLFKFHFHFSFIGVRQGGNDVDTAEIRTMGSLIMIESRVKYIGWIIKRKSLSCHHLQGRRLPRSGTTQSLKEEKYSLAVAKSLAGGSWEIAKIGRVLQLLIQGNILGLSGFGRAV